MENYEEIYAELEDEFTPIVHYSEHEGAWMINSHLDSHFLDNAITKLEQRAQHAIIEATAAPSAEANNFLAKLAVLLRVFKLPEDKKIFSYGKIGFTERMYIKVTSDKYDNHPHIQEYDDWNKKNFTRCVDLLTDFGKRMVVFLEMATNLQPPKILAPGNNKDNNLPEKLLVIDSDQNTHIANNLLWELRRKNLIDSRTNAAVFKNLLESADQEVVPVRWLGSQTELVYLFITLLLEEKRIIESQGSMYEALKKSFVTVDNLPLGNNLRQLKAKIPKRYPMLKGIADKLERVYSKRKNRK